MTTAGQSSNLGSFYVRIGMGPTKVKYKFLFIYLLAFTPFASCLKTTKMKSDCDALTRAYYYGNSCVVGVTTVGNNWPVSKDGCTELSNGHLATFPTMDQVNTFLNKLVEWGADNNWIFWIGLFQTNTTDEPAGNWHWSLANGREVPVAVIQGSMGWTAANPNNDLAGDECAVFGKLYHIFDVPCLSGRWSLCEYDDPDQERKYRRKFKGHRAHASSVLGEEYVSDRLACGRLCTADPICHSFSYSNTNGHCIMSQDDGTHPAYPVVPNADYDIHVWQME